MDAPDIAGRLAERFGEQLVDSDMEAVDPTCVVAAAAVAEVGLFLRDEPDLAFDSLMCLSGVDYGVKLGVVYNLHSLTHRHRFCLKVLVEREGEPRVASVAAVWPTADWHEREAYDMVGIVFDGHPDPRRILLPDDWEGFPLRKDYKFPRQWHDIPV